MYDICGKMYPNIGMLHHFYPLDSVSKSTQLPISGPKVFRFSLVGHSPKHHIIFFHINNRSYLAPFPPIVDSSVRYHNVLESSYELFNNEAHLTINIIKTLDNVFKMHSISSEKSCNDMPLAMFALLEEISLGPRWETPVLPEFHSCRCH